MLLHINVANKVAAYSRRDGELVCGNNDYQVKFTFDEEWNDHEEKTARFIWNGRYTDVDFTGDTCPVPLISGATSVEVGVYAGDLRTTTPAVIFCQRSILCGGEGQRPESAEVYTNEAKAAADRAEAAAEEAAEAAREEVATLVGEIGIAQRLGESVTSAVSQKTVTEIVGAVKKFLAVDIENIVGYVINGAGAITAASNYAYITDYIPVTVGRPYHIAGSAHWGNAIYAYYDANKALVSVGRDSVAQSARTFIDEEVVIPNGVSYMVVSGSNEIPPKVYSPMLVTLSDKYIYKATINDAGVVQVKDTLSEKICVTDYIPVTVGRSYHIKGSANWASAIYAYYDENKSIVRVGATSQNQSARTYVDEDITIPNGAVYIIVSGNTDGLPSVVSNEDYEYEIPKKWSGKKWACVGDSLTEKNIRTTKNYHDYVADDTGITVINMGISGTGYKRRYENSQAFYQRVSSIPRDVDVVTIFGSGNDLYMYGDVLGEATDTGTDTLCGCINTTIDNLYAVLPTVQLGIVTPTPWDAYSLTNPNNIMERYSDKLIEICKRRGIPCLDLYRCSGLRPWDETFRTLAYSKDDGGGTHPDETGHAIIAPRFKAFLETLLL